MLLPVTFDTEDTHRRNTEDMNIFMLTNLNKICYRYQTPHFCLTTVSRANVTLYEWKCSSRRKWTYMVHMFSFSNKKQSANYMKGVVTSAWVCVCMCVYELLFNEQYYMVKIQSVPLELVQRIMQMFILWNQSERNFTFTFLYPCSNRK